MSVNSIMIVVRLVHHMNPFECKRLLFNFFQKLFLPVNSAFSFCIHWTEAHRQKTSVRHKPVRLVRQECPVWVCHKAKISKLLGVEGRMSPRRTCYRPDRVKKVDFILIFQTLPKMSQFTGLVTKRVKCKGASVNASTSITANQHRLSVCN